MSNRINLVAFFALGVLGFLIWTDPAGAASTVGDFLGNVAGFLKDLLGRVTEFLGSFGE